jgi:hypothetical protein
VWDFHFVPDDRTTTTTMMMMMMADTNEMQLSVGSETRWTPDIPHMRMYTRGNRTGCGWYQDRDTPHGMSATNH